MISESLSAMNMRPINVDFAVVRRPRAPLMTFDEGLRLAEIAVGLGLLSFALYCVHLFLRNNFG